MHSQTTLKTKDFVEGNEETAEAQQTKPVPVHSSDNTRDMNDSVENSKDKTPSFEK